VHFFVGQLSLSALLARANERVLHFLLLAQGVLGSVHRALWVAGDHDLLQCFDYASFEFTLHWLPTTSQSANYAVHSSFFLYIAGIVSSCCDIASHI